MRELCGAHAEFVCSECELRELLGHFLEAAHGITTCPSAKVGRRRLAQLTQMMVSAELEERVRCEGSPTLMATLSEIQLYLMASASFTGWPAAPAIWQSAGSVADSAVALVF